MPACASAAGLPVTCPRVLPSDHAPTGIASWDVDRRHGETGRTGPAYASTMPPRSRVYVTDAIVLSRFALGEADRVLTVITPELGKLRVIAKGVRKPTSRIGGTLEPFAELRLQLAHGRTFEVVTQAAVNHAWLRLRDSLESAA